MSFLVRRYETHKIILPFTSKCYQRIPQHTKFVNLFCLDFCNLSCFKSITHFMAFFQTHFKLKTPSLYFFRCSNTTTFQKTPTKNLRRYLSLCSTSSQFAPQSIRCTHNSINKTTYDKLYLFQRPKHLLTKTLLGFRYSYPTSLRSCTIHTHAKIMSSSSSSSSSTFFSPHQLLCMDNAREIFNVAVQSVLPQQMVRQHMTFDSDNLTIRDKSYGVNRNVYVVGFGKAVLGMARAVDDLIGQHIVKGVVSVPYGIQETFIKYGKRDMLLRPDSSITVIEGAADNLPDTSAHQAALQVAELIKPLGKEDILIVLISGGGSALLPAPYPSISLDDMLKVTGQMSKGGATISQLNTVRKQLDFLKGGGLAEMACPAQVVSLILSDIVGDPLDLIASGPTVPDPSTPKDCLEIFAQLNITSSIPQAVTDFLKEKASLLVQTMKEERCIDDRVVKNLVQFDKNISKAEYDGECVANKKKNNKGSLKSFDGTSAATSSNIGSDKIDDRIETGAQYCYDNIQNVVIGSNSIACESACQKALEMGYFPIVLSTQLEGEARVVGEMFANLGVYIAALERRFQLLMSNRGRNHEDDIDNVEEMINEIKRRLILKYKLTENKLPEIEKCVIECMDSFSIGDKDSDFNTKMKVKVKGICVVAGGETTVTVTGSGRGGRNQEMVVSAGIELENCYNWMNESKYFGNENIMKKEEKIHSIDENLEFENSGDRKFVSVNFTRSMTFLSAGTDGQDGPTPAAGAVIALPDYGKDDVKLSCDTVWRNAGKYLDNNDCFSLLQKWEYGKGLVMTGLTGTNVMDIHLLLVPF